MKSKSRSVKEASIDPLAPFLAGSIRMLRLTLEQADSAIYAETSKGLCRAVEGTDITGLAECFAFVSDLRDVAHSTSFDEAEFQVYLAMGQSTINSLRPNARLNGLIDTIQKGLDSFKSSWQLESGQSMDRIWNCIRPPTSTELEQLKRKLAVEQLAERFDSLIWTSEVSLRELSQLRQMIAKMGEVITTSNESLRDNMEVSLIKSFEQSHTYFFRASLMHFTISKHDMDSCSIRKAHTCNRNSKPCVNIKQL